MAVNQTVEVYIDKLVLHGFSAHQHQDITAAVEAELTRLFSEGGVPASIKAGGNIAALNAVSANISKNSKGKALGSKIAGSVYKRLGK